MSKIALVTGATSGIGEAAARLFASHGYRLIITGRREDRLNALKESLNTEVLALVFDVRQQQAVEAAINGLPAAWKDIDVLVNNAGLAVGLSPLQEGVVDDWERMIDTNIKGLLYVSRNVLPLMITRKKGHVINIGSIAGKEVYPNGNVYCGTKHAVDAISQGMRIDTVQHGIKVTAIHPGAVETEFSIVRFKGDEERANAVYKGFEPLTAKDVAESIYYVTTLPAHANINDLVLMPTAQASATVLHRNG
ncbi:MAG: SDR family NAD(P)-dependent oxidoreductase [Flavobacteriales bacterium]|nr:SDR family NAD(P)-dependent oxidoreductase [Flavobacteriales bacterium]MCB9448456.1 SDR family NAD(P)-dependent oxidoreductase [Flavobacteriales bacterium]